MTDDADDFDYSSATVPKGAVFVQADEPLLVYPSVAAAEGHLEAVDVENGVYPAAFGPNGEPYYLCSERGRVQIRRTGEHNNPDELKVLLLNYLRARGEPTEATTSVADLVAIVWSMESAFWQEHDPYGDRFSSRLPLWGCAALIFVLAAILYFIMR